MSQILNSLKFVQAKRVNAQIDAVAFRREKLVRKIDEQITLVNVVGDGGNRSFKASKRVTNEDGSTSSVEVQRKARAWWFQSEKGTLCISIRYGAKAIELAKGRNAIEVASVDQLASTLEAVKKAVINGELDAQITATAEAVKARFKKK
jgi:hypothetical protein